MKKSLEEHASRFDEVAGEYDDSQNDTDEYRACVSLVVDHANPGPDDTVADLGTGTGAIALALADDAGEVLGRDISDGMMEQAREKAESQGIENVAFAEGRFREPNVDSADVVVSNFAMHHLSDEEKREAIEAIAELGPRKFVLGDVMFFGTPDPDEPFYSPEVDDPSTVGHLADALTEAGFALTAVEKVHEQVGVLVAERGNGE
ncbi:class I SAM-dependent methyltransferase [Halorussus caseinilyticus]|uniref:Class I SAM-dependent methyltransferase n=1 Tax=Halorussus caseinilyticus TaxID=3034025 RepID=A0ABD5WM68_9EURY|nr:class I SAM-dependent methyltransferase [Halorussus sp. DT72]